MKKTLLTILTISSSIFLLTGCANYRAAPLNIIASETVFASSSSKDVVVAAKAFDKADCKRYLDRDVISKGFQPVQLYIQNNSDSNYLFSINRISLPSARPEEAAQQVHTSTIGRVLAYGIPGLVLLWPLLIPAVVDGIKSSEANSALDVDFSSKAARDQIIVSNSHFNKILFVPVSDYQSSFTVTLENETTHQQKTLIVFAN